jgi:hypothetical protein
MDGYPPDSSGGLEHREATEEEYAIEQAARAGQDG